LNDSSVQTPILLIDSLFGQKHGHSKRLYKLTASIWERTPLTQPWQKQSDGSLLRTLGNLRLVVQPHPVNGAIRFLLIREAANRPGIMGALIRSGYEQSVACAMAAAEKIAARLMDMMPAPAAQERMLADTAMPA
jgi:hypothetical protein